MAQNDLSPRVYMACLSCYNNGQMHGMWFDADETLPDAMAEYFRIKDGFSNCGGEEFVVHDHEGFGGHQLGEVSADEAVKIGAFLTEHGIPGALALANFSGDIDQAESAVTDSYRGAFSSLEDFAQEFHEECGDALKGAGHLAAYIDWERVARDMEMNGDIWSETGPDGQVHVFWND